MPRYIRAGGESLFAFATSHLIVRNLVAGRIGAQRQLRLWLKNQFLALSDRFYEGHDEIEGRLMDIIVAI